MGRPTCLIKSQPRNWLVFAKKETLTAEDISFDFVSGDKRLVFSVPKNQTVVRVDLAFPLDQTSVEWINDSTVRITTHQVSEDWTEFESREVADIIEISL